MIPGRFRIITRSINYRRKPVLYQILIIVLLSAVITGSLLTGRSVKESLKKLSSEHLGNTGIIISSGTRSFDSDLVQRMKDSANLKCTGILELNGYCQSLNSQKGANNSHIYGINDDFFSFNGFDSLKINTGEVAINRALADDIGVKTGEDLIIRFSEISDIPSDAPFAPGNRTAKSIVLKIGIILEPAGIGNFSLSISQISPRNVFVNLSDIEEKRTNSYKLNRLLFKRDRNYSLTILSNAFQQYLRHPDIGLRLRTVNKTGQSEIISDRVFIDKTIVNEIAKILPVSAPVLTYLGNRFISGKRSTPYSFISALPSSVYPDIVNNNEMIINRWMAEDLEVSPGDTIQMFWYSPDLLNKLVEKSSMFVVKRVVDIQGIWSDSLLMPDFPGISGRESCSDWDAGIPIKMHEIRQKDEDYWNRFKGTPKAFINYETGKKMWGNNFGPATALRFPEGVTEKMIEDKLAGSLNPEKMGFNVTDLYADSLKAADEGVDFSTLFLSLGFFLILASIILLSFAVSSYFDLKREHLRTLYSLGFKNRWIAQILFLESGVVGLIGCLTGAFAGYLVNVSITSALNTVWKGAVQTNTLYAYFNIEPLFTGFILTFLSIMVFMWIKIKRFLNMLNKKKKEIYTSTLPIRNTILLVIAGSVTISLFVLSFIFKEKELAFFFATGTALLLTSILFCRQYFTGSLFNDSGRIKNNKSMSRLYYSANSSHAITPILFIAAGVFTVFITGANRMNLNEKQLERTGGTGGFLLWCESAIPIKEDLNTASGRKTLGLDNDQLSTMNFVQIKRRLGNDASCLNLNHVTAPPLLGIDPDDFISKQSFSFSKVAANSTVQNPWQFLNISPVNNTIYGIADQTVLDWGLKLKTGDTLILRSENGQPLNIIIAAGLQSSVFQGNVLIGKEDFSRFYPSSSGSSILLVEGDRALIDLYKNTLNDRLQNWGVSIEETTRRLASFYEVTNTYLSVFEVFGALGMIIGIAGLGFVLLKNYNQRKRDFALLLAIGYQVKKIRKMILSEQLLILFAGVSCGIVSAMVATLPSLRNSPNIPWSFMIGMVAAILTTGIITLVISVRSVTKNSLIESLKKE
jgi:putative ABC transport system permease protein